MTLKIFTFQYWVPLVLLILGIQLSKTKINFKSFDVYLSSFLRLIVSPVISYFLIVLLGFSGVIGQALLIGASAPTAINIALIAIDRKNNADFTSQTVMTSTILCSITLVIVVYFSRILFPV